MVNDFNKSINEHESVLCRKKKRSSKKQKTDQPKQGEEGFDPYDFDSYEEDEDDTEGKGNTNSIGQNIHFSCIDTFQNCGI